MLGAERHMVKFGGFSWGVKLVLDASYIREALTQRRAARAAIYHIHQEGMPGAVPSHLIYTHTAGSE